MLDRETMVESSSKNCAEACFTRKVVSLCSAGRASRVQVSKCVIYEELLLFSTYQAVWSIRQLVIWHLKVYTYTEYIFRQQINAEPHKWFARDHFPSLFNPREFAWLNCEGDSVDRWGRFYSKFYTVSLLVQRLFWYILSMLAQNAPHPFYSVILYTYLLPLPLSLTCGSPTMLSF